MMVCPAVSAVKAALAGRRCSSTAAARCRFAADHLDTPQARNNEEEWQRMAKSQMAPVLAWLSQMQQQHLTDLKDLISIPSVSTDQRHQGEVQRGARLICRLMRRAGLKNVGLLRVDESNPYAYGEWLAAPGAPTLFLYAHQDVQPAGAEHEWRSSPWQLTRRGGRIYGRGVADDKGAIGAQLAAVAAFLKTRGSLPVNIKMLVESEEEIGSPNLQRFFEQHHEQIRSDVIVVCDTENLATGWPSITYSLRGIVQMLVKVRCAQRAVHSGIGGGFMPDAALALNVLLARLYRGDGKSAVPALERGVLPPSRQQRESLVRLPGSVSTWRRDFGMLPGVRFANDPRRHPYEQIWRRPSITIVAQQASSIQGRSNQILPEAAAVVSCRTVPNQQSNEVFDALRQVLTADPPWNAQVKIEPLGSVDWWMTEPTGPAFSIACAALGAGFKKEPALIGSGGSIGFVRPLSQLFDDAPALLLGIGDPQSNPHAANESLNVADFQKLVRSLAHLFDGLGQISAPRGERRVESGGKACGQAG